MSVTYSCDTCGNKNIGDDRHSKTVNVELPLAKVAVTIDIRGDQRLSDLCLACALKAAQHAVVVLRNKILDDPRWTSAAMRGDSE